MFTFAAYSATKLSQLTPLLCSMSYQPKHVLISCRLEANERLFMA
jgi:hypothetical protein